MKSQKISASQTIKYYWQHMMRYPGLTAGMVFAMPVAVLTNRFLPALIIAGILDRLSRHDFVHGDVWGSFGGDLALAVGLSILGGVFMWRIVSYFNWKLEGHVMKDMHNEIFAHIMKLDANFHANHFAGSLVSQANKLVGAYPRFTDTSLFTVGNLIVSLIFSAIILRQRAPLFVIVLVALTTLYIVGSIIMTRKVRELSSVEAEASNTQTGYLADSITNVLAVKSFAATTTEQKRYEKSSEKRRTTFMAIMRAALLRELGFTGINNVLFGASLVLAAVSIVVYDANVATVFLILTYTTNINEKLWDFSTNALRNYNRAFGDAEGMMEILATAPSISDPDHTEKVKIDKGAIQFNNVGFAHPDSGAGASLFKNMNLAIAPGEKIGLVGHSGSGKTTLTKLLLRFIDINAGEILIDGQNIARISQDDLRHHISYVPQEPMLFHRSIRENIAYGKPNASEAEIIEAARKANSDDFIKTLPHGYDTLVGERGVKLSGGQRQRIAIARAIIKDAPILVLDEATSALDSESEKLIQAALLELMKNRTTIVIAHRLSTIQKMDRIIVLNNGKIVEEGTHKQLLECSGTYAKLWAHQSGGFIDE